ncbi:MAG TPA: biotin transporter BioY [Terriglobales bacterium]|jgi:biotin transport system substrate-specific component
MSQSLTQVAERRNGALDIARQAALVVGASLFVAVCAHIYLPLPGTPVPLTIQNLAVLLVGLSLGSRRGFLALALYLAEGASGLPVFSPTGPGGIAQLIGPTAGYLIAYPFVAALAGFIFELGKPTFSRAAIAAISGEILLFASGISWLYILTHSLARAISLGLYWFIFAEIMKVMLAAGAVNTGHRFFPHSDEADTKAPE